MRLHYNQVAKTILDVREDKRNECYNFGKDNAYPSLTEALLNISVTAKTCVDRVAKAIYGGSFGELGNVVVNSKGQTLNEVLRIAAREYAKHNNVFIQVVPNGNLEYKSIVVIPVTYVRVGKSDDMGYSGKFIVYNNWDKQKEKRIMSSKFMVIDRFSRREDVLVGQIEACGGINKFNGQIIHIKKEEASVYSLSDLHTVMSEALLEGNSQTFRSRGAEKGFLNTKLLATQPMEEDEAKEFKRELNGVRGSENSSEVVHLAATQPTEDLSKQIFLGDLSSPYNDKLFEYSDKQSEKNLCKAYSVPLVLVNPSDDGLFGNSGEVLKEAKKQLYESREEERDQLEEVFDMIMKNFVNPIENLKVVNPFEGINQTTDINE